MDMVGQCLTVLAAGASGVVWTFFCRVFSLSGDTARYRLKYCLTGSFDPQQPTNQNSLCDFKSTNEIFSWGAVEFIASRGREK